MTKEKKFIRREKIYMSGIRYYAPIHPYRILVEFDRCDREIIIMNYSVNDKRVTHGVGFKIGDLERILKNLKKLQNKK